MKITSEVRPNMGKDGKPDGTVDEVIIEVDGKCVFHLEQMDKGYYWFVVYDDEHGHDGRHFDMVSRGVIRLTERG